MGPKDAIERAKSYVQDIFSGEDIMNLGLEEIEKEPGQDVWAVTLGFSRPWNAIRNAMTNLTGDPTPRRSFKVVRLDGDTGELLSIKRRESQLEGA